MKYTMNKDELGKLVIISGTVDGAYTIKEAAAPTGDCRCGGETGKR
jgi:hypothetical protein